MALNPLLSLIGRLVARSGRKRGNRQTDRQTDRQNDKTTTITLAAHARRGLIMNDIYVRAFKRLFIIIYRFAEVAMRYIF